jgi:hypothetical protein
MLRDKLELSGTRFQCTAVDPANWYRSAGKSKPALFNNLSSVRYGKQSQETKEAMSRLASRKSDVSEALHGFKY